MAQADPSRSPPHLVGGTALGSAAGRQPVPRPGGAAAPPQLRRPGGNPPRTARRALRFRGGFSGTARIRHVGRRRASRADLRLPPVAGPRTPRRPVLLPPDI